MPRNITELRERIRNEQQALDEQRARNRALVDDSAATAEQIDAAMAETRRLDARVRMLNDELTAEESRQRGSLSPVSAHGSAISDRRSDILRSNEYARAFAFAVTNGLNRKTARGMEQTKILFDAMTEGTGADGGFLVPEDVQNMIIERVRDLKPLSDLFGVETVTAPTGWRVIDTAPTKGLVAVDEMGQIDDDDDQPVFAKVSYSCTKKALILPVSNELVSDNVANLFAYLSGWFAKKLVITENALLIAAMQTLSPTSINSDPLKGIKTALNKDLDPAVSAIAKLITNQTAFDVLDGLTDGTDRPLLQPNPTDETMYRVKGREVTMVSDAQLANVSGSPSTADIFIGAPELFAKLFRCGNFEVASTDIGGSAWRTDSTELRGIVRNGVSKFDAYAMVRRTVNVPA